jgi:hypothetical protein
LVGCPRRRTVHSDFAAARLFLERAFVALRGDDEFSVKRSPLSSRHAPESKLAAPLLMSPLAPLIGLFS